MTTATPLASVLRASMRAEENPICKALDEMLGMCDLHVFEQRIRAACQAKEQDDSLDITEQLANVCAKAMSATTPAQERAVTYLVLGTLFTGLYQLHAVLEDIVYPMYLDPEDIRASVLE